MKSARATARPFSTIATALLDGTVSGNELKEYLVRFVSAPSAAGDGLKYLKDSDLNKKLPQLPKDFRRSLKKNLGTDPAQPPWNKATLIGYKASAHTDGSGQGDATAVQLESGTILVSIRGSGPKLGEVCADFVSGWSATEELDELTKGYYFSSADHVKSAVLDDSKPTLRDRLAVEDALLKQ